MDSPILPALPLPKVPALAFPILSLLIQYGIGAILLAMVIRAIASWFQLDERFAFIRFLAYITDPFIVPCRRFGRVGVGMLDLSWIIAFFLLSTIQILLWQSLPGNW